MAQQDQKGSVKSGKCIDLSYRQVLLRRFRLDPTGTGELFEVFKQVGKREVQEENQDPSRNLQNDGDWKQGYMRLEPTAWMGNGGGWVSF